MIKYWQLKSNIPAQIKHSRKTTLHNTNYCIEKPLARIDYKKVKTADKYEISTEIDVPKYSICKTIMKGKSCRSLDRVESNFAKGELKFEYNKGLRVSRSGVALTNPETCREFEGGTTLDLVSNFDTNQQIMSLKHKVSLAAETNCRNKSLVFNVELFNPVKRDFSKLFGMPKCQIYV